MKSYKERMYFNGEMCGEYGIKQDIRGRFVSDIDIRFEFMMWLYDHLPAEQWDDVNIGEIVTGRIYDGINVSCSGKDWVFKVELVEV